MYVKYVCFLTIMNFKAGMAGGMLVQCHSFESFVSSSASSTKARQFRGVSASGQAISVVHSHSLKRLLE